MAVNRRSNERREIPLDGFGITVLAGAVILVLSAVFFLGVHYGRSAKSEEAKTARLNLLPPPNPPRIVAAPPKPPTVDLTFAERLTKPETEPVLPKFETTQAQMKSPSETQGPREENFSIQAGAFREKKQAEELLVSLKEKGFDAFLGPTHYGTSGKWYRVWVGGFVSKSEASEEMARLREGSFKSTFVVSLKSRGERTEGEDSKAVSRAD